MIDALELGRPPPLLTLPRRVAFAPLLSFGLLGLLLLSLVFAQRTLESSADESGHTAELRLRIRGVLTSLLDAETGQRGYLLTGDVAYLDPYLRAEGDVPRAIASVDELVAPSELEAARVDTVRRLADHKLAELGQTVVLARSGERERALDIVRSDRGRHTMDELRDVLGAMEADETTRLAHRAAHTRRVGAMMLALSLFAMASLVATVVSYRSARTEAVRERRALAERASLTSQLESSEGRLRRLVDSGLLGVVFFDLEQGILGANDTFLAMTGYRREDVEAGRVELDALRADAPTGQRSARSLRERGVTPTYETRLRRRDGALVTVLAGAALFEGSKDRGVAYMIDITERRVAEDAVLRSARRLAALHALDRAILRADSVEALARAASERVGGILDGALVVVTRFDAARGEAEVLAWEGNPELLPPTRRLGVPPGFSEALAADGFVVRTHGEAHPLWDAGMPAERAACVASVPISAHGDVAGTLDVVGGPGCLFGPDARDVLVEVAAQISVALEQARLREQLRAHAADLEREVEARTAALRRANEDLEAFSYSVSHDLRAPLRGMQGYALALLEDFGPALDEGGRGYAERIAAAAARMETLIEDLLSFGRLSRAELASRPVALSKVVDDALLDMASDIERARAEVVVHREGMPTVRAHAPTVLLCVENLVANALKFVRPGERPHVEVRCEPSPDAPGRVRLVVEDRGIGIAPEHHERVFQVFERLHGRETYEGTGIGLAIVKRAAERMGGSVGVRSEPGRGSTFWIELPEEAS